MKAFVIAVLDLLVLVSASPIENIKASLAVNTQARSTALDGSFVVCREVNYLNCETINFKDGVCYNHDTTGPDWRSDRVPANTHCDVFQYDNCQGEQALLVGDIPNDSWSTTHAYRCSRSSMRSVDTINQRDISTNTALTQTRRAAQDGGIGFCRTGSPADCPTWISFQNGHCSNLALDYSWSSVMMAFGTYCDFFNQVSCQGDSTAIDPQSGENVGEWGAKTHSFKCYGSALHSIDTIDKRDNSTNTGLALPKLSSESPLEHAVNSPALPGLIDLCRDTNYGNCILGFGFGSWLCYNYPDNTDYHSIRFFGDTRCQLFTYANCLGGAYTVWEATPDLGHWSWDAVSFSCYRET